VASQLPHVRWRRQSFSELQRTGRSLPWPKGRTARPRLPAVPGLRGFPRPGITLRSTDYSYRLSAWELDVMLPLTSLLQVDRHVRLSVGTRWTPLLTLPSGTQRARSRIGGTTTPIVSLSGKDIGCSCFPILAMSCGIWSADVRDRSAQLRHVDRADKVEMVIVSEYRLRPHDSRGPRWLNSIWSRIGWDRYGSSMSFYLVALILLLLLWQNTK
jgi:hypothetical protein